jgi:hypothetical protein
MNHKVLMIFLVIVISLLQYNCAPSLRSAKVQPGFSVDGVLLGTVFSASATDEFGNDEGTESSFDSPIPLDVKFRYGWERTENFGFELTGGLDGQMGAYLELPGSDTFHWGIGAETNLWIISLAGNIDEDDDDVANFIKDNNYNAFLMAGFFPSPEFEISVGVKYQPFLKSLLDAVSEVGVDEGDALPLSYQLDARYMFSDNWGMMLGAEIFNLTVEGEGQAEVSTTGGYLYLGLTYR